MLQLSISLLHSLRREDVQKLLWGTRVCISKDFFSLLENMFWYTLPVTIALYSFCFCLLHRWLILLSVSLIQINLYEGILIWKSSYFFDIFPNIIHNNKYMYSVQYVATECIRNVENKSACWVRSMIDMLWSFFFYNCIRDEFL